MDPKREGKAAILPILDCMLTLCVYNTLFTFDPISNTFKKWLLSAGGRSYNILTNTTGRLFRRIKEKKKQETKYSKGNFFSVSNPPSSFGGKVMKCLTLLCEMAGETQWHCSLPVCFSSPLFGGWVKTGQMGDLKRIVCISHNLTS